MTDELDRLRRFHDDARFRQYQSFPGSWLRRTASDDPVHRLLPTQIVPYLLTAQARASCFVRNVGAFVPPYDQSQRIPWHGSRNRVSAVLKPECEAHRCLRYIAGAIRALAVAGATEAQNLALWLELGREAALPWAEPALRVLRRTEQRLMVPMVRRSGWHDLTGWLRFRRGRRNSGRRSMVVSVKVEDGEISCSTFLMLDSASRQSQIELSPDTGPTSWREMLMVPMAESPTPSNAR